MTAGVSVSDKEVENEYRNRNEKATLTYFVIDPAKLETKIAALTDQELRTYYDKNSARYNVPEKRKSRYAFVDMVKFRTELKADDEELRNFYGEHAEEYRLPEQITAQHILFKTEGKTPEQVEAIRKKATDVLDTSEERRRLLQTRQGILRRCLGLARRRPWNVRARSQMAAAEFEQAAFVLGAGAISDLVTTPDGFHIIKVNARQESRLRTFRRNQGSDPPPPPL